VRVGDVSENKGGFVERLDGETIRAMRFTLKAEQLIVATERQLLAILLGDTPPEAIVKAEGDEAAGHATGKQRK
jgi:hypothetical protein